MPADALTKPLERKRFAALRNYIMNKGSFQRGSSDESERRDESKSISRDARSIKHAIPNSDELVHNLDDARPGQAEADIMSPTTMA